jgi:hypothetical protein
MPLLSPGFQLLFGYVVCAQYERYGFPYAFKRWLAGSLQGLRFCRFIKRAVDMQPQVAGFILLAHSPHKISNGKDNASVFADFNQSGHAVNSIATVTDMSGPTEHSRQWRNCACLPDGVLRFVAGFKCRFA